MKVLTLRPLAALILTLALFGCGGQRKPPEKLTIFSDGQNVPTSADVITANHVALKTYLMEHYDGSGLVYSVSTDGKTYTLKLIKLEMKDRNETLVIENEKLIAGLQALFKGELNIQGVKPSTGVPVVTRLTLTSMESEEQAIASPTILTKEYEGLLLDMKTLVLSTFH